MNKGISIALLAVGILLIVYGFNAANSIAAGMSRTLTGAPTNKALWLQVGGVAAAMIGTLLTLRPSVKT